MKDKTLMIISIRAKKKPLTKSNICMIKMLKTKTRRDFLIKGIYEKPTANMTLNVERRIAFLLR